MARQRGKLWQADVRLPDGKRLRPTFKTRAAAEAWESSAKLAVEEGKPLPPHATVSRRSSERDLATLGPLYDFVKRTEWNPQRSGVTLARNGQWVVDHFGRNKPVAEITSADLANMKVSATEQGLAPSTANRMLAAASKLLRVAMENGVIEAKPKARWNKVEKTKFRFVDDVEERAILAYWNAVNLPDLHDLTVLLIDTGARCFSEMMPVRWDAFGPNFSTVSFWHTKTNRPRTVPLTKRARDIIAARHKVRGDKFGPFAAINKHAMRTRWDAMRETLQLPDVTPHVMRHTCCTRLVLGGVDVKRVMEWMGHDAIVTTMRYMQIKPNSLEEIVHVLERKPPKEDPGDPLAEAA